MATDQFSPTPVAKPTTGSGGQTHAAPTHSSAPAHTSQPPKVTPARPTGFVRTPAAPVPSFKAQHEPEASSLGRYVTIGAIVILVILLIFQVASKNSLRNQVQTLEEQNTALSQQASVTPTSAPTAITPTVPTTGALQLVTYPVLFREKQFQKIAQTISVTSTARIGGISLRGTAGEGSAGQVAIYEGVTPAQINTRKDIVRQSFDTTKLTLDPSLFVEFRRPVELKAGVGYTIVIETTNRTTVANIAYRLATPTAPGTMWVYSRKLSETGDVLAQDFSWQEIPGYDLFFELRGVE